MVALSTNESVSNSVSPHVSACAKHEGLLSRPRTQQQGAAAPTHKRTRARTMSVALHVCGTLSSDLSSAFVQKCLGMSLMIEGEVGVARGEVNPVMACRYCTHLNHAVSAALSLAGRGGEGTAGGQGGGKGG